MTTIVVFSSSLAVASLMIIIKAFEMRSGRSNLILRLIGKMDDKLASLISLTKFRTLQLIQSVRYIILVQVREFSRELFERAHEKILNEYRVRQSAIMGRRDVLNRGSVSFYLKKITEEKGGVRGKIEQEM